jgi:hypothetical protein
MISLQKRRRLLGIAAALGGASCIPLAIRHVMAAGNRPVAPGFYRIEGDVRLNDAPARVGQLVRAGDTVVTGADSQAVFVVGEDAFLLRASSRLSTSGKDAFINLLRITTGKLLSVFGPGERKFHTPAATVGIRGTGIYVESEPRRSYVCTCYGIADIQAIDMPDAKETVRTTHHDQPRYIYAGRTDGPAIEMIKKAPVINHTDEELIMLEALVGRYPPFYGTDLVGRY